MQPPYDVVGLQSNSPYRFVPAPAGFDGIAGDGAAPSILCRRFHSRLLKKNNSDFCDPLRDDGTGDNENFREMIAVDNIIETNDALFDFFSIAGDNAMQRPQESPLGHPVNARRRVFARATIHLL
jgi:hypothetical protein